jgi:hypothetical protein
MKSLILLHLFERLSLAFQSTEASRILLTKLMFTAFFS